MPKLISRGFVTYLFTSLILLRNQNGHYLGCCSFITPRMSRAAGGSRYVCSCFGAEISALSADIAAHHELVGWRTEESDRLVKSRMDHQPNVEPRGQSMKLSVVRPRAAKARRVSEDIPGAVGADSSNGTRYPDSSTQQKRSPTPGSFRHELAESYTQSQSLATQLGCLVAIPIYGSPSSILRFRSSSPLLPGIYFVSFQRLGAMLVPPPSVAALGNGTWHELFSKSIICSLLSPPPCSCNCPVVNPCGAWLRKHKSLLVFCSLSLIVRVIWRVLAFFNSSRLYSYKSEFSEV